MKRRFRQRICLAFFGVLLAAGGGTVAAAQETKQETEQESEADRESSYVDSMRGEMDFDAIDEMLVETELAGEEITFSDLVDGLLADGIAEFDYGKILRWGKQILFSEIEENRRILVEVVILAVGFAVLQNFSGAFQKAYIAEVCFMLVYCILTALLLESFLGFQSVTEKAIQKSVDFMQAMIPAYCIAMVFASGTASSLGFYQIAFVVIYLIQWLFLKILMPLIQCFVLLKLLDHYAAKQRFENLAGLLKAIIEWGMKIAGMSVLGLNVVQNLISPAKDRLTGGLVGKAAAVLPGIGNAVSAVSELLVGSGILIRNCVGAAALCVLVLLGAAPMLKLLCMSFFYKLAAVVTEPVADKRIAGMLKGMAEGGVLYLKLLGYSLVLFLLTIALTTASSGYL